MLMNNLKNFSEKPDKTMSGKIADTPYFAREPSMGRKS